MWDHGFVHKILSKQIVEQLWLKTKVSETYAGSVFSCNLVLIREEDKHFFIGRFCNAHVISSRLHVFFGRRMKIGKASVKQVDCTCKTKWCVLHAAEIRDRCGQSQRHFLYSAIFHLIRLQEHNFIWKIIRSNIGNSYTWFAVQAFLFYLSLSK